MKQRIITLIALLCTFAGTAGATTKTYTVSGGQGGSQDEFYALFSDGGSSSGQVNWTYNSTAEISFSLPGGLTLKLSDTAKQLSVREGNSIGGQGSTTLTVSSQTYYIYRVRLLDSSGDVIQLNANGEAVAHDGVAECDYWNMTKSFSHTFSNGILFSKIEVSYNTAIPITDAVITGLSSQYSVSNTAIMPTPTVTWHGTTLTLGTHCTISYLNNTAAGTATVTATGKGIFSSSTSVSANYTLVWATYSVRFNKNNDAATGTMSNQDFTYSTAQNLTANAFSRTGYTFAAWNRAANGSGTSYADEQEVQNLTATNGGTVDLYAQWTANTYTLRLHHNVGTEAYTDMAMTYDQPKNIQSISRTGYTFDGWSTAPDGDVVYTDGQEVQNLTATNGGIIDLYAQWTANTYSITYDLAGGTVATANPTSYSIESNNFTLANPTRTGYTFDGWTGTDLNEPTMEVTILTGSFGDRTYTATWTDVWGMAEGANGSQAHPYIITTTAGLDFLAQSVNSGSNEYGNTYFKLGADITYPHTTDWDDANSMENNYTAIGTEEKAFCGIFDGDGHTVSGIRINKPSDEYQGLFGRVYGAIVKNVTLNDARITGFDYVSGISGQMNGNPTTIENCLVLNTAITANFSRGTVVGYRRNGTLNNNHYRNCTVNGSATNVGTSSGDQTGARSVHALTLPDGVTATGESIVIDGVTYYASNTTVTLTYSGEVPMGYQVFYSVNGTPINGNTFTMPAEDVTVSADVKIAYTLRLHHNDGTDEYTDMSLAFNEEQNIQSITITREGCIFEGWSTTVDGAVVYTDGQEVINLTTTPGATVDLYAQWTDVWGMAEGANGSQAHPYVITTTAGLDLLAQRVNSGYYSSGKYFVLGADITYPHTTDWDDATSTENNYTPIGNSNYFYGTFDGQGHTVSGIRIYKGGSDYTADAFLGLFGALTGVVKNVTVSDMRITGYDFVGGIAGYKLAGVNNNIENCHATATVCLNAVQDGAKRFGGIVGANDMGKINSCTSAATITVADNLTNCRNFGGIAGYLNSNVYNEVNVSNCLAMGVTIPDVPSSGVIVGLLSYGVLSNNYYSGCTLGGTPTPSGIGVGYEYSNNARHDVTDNNGAVPCTALHTLTLGENITATGALLNQGGTISVPSGSTVALSYSGLGTDQIAIFKLNDNELSGNSFTMPDADASVNASAFTVWGIDEDADGSAANPYVITRTQELNLLAQRVNSGNNFSGKYFVLDNDIAYNHTTAWDDATSTENNYTPIGNNSYQFYGTFDGQGHTVSGIRIYKGGSDYTADAYLGLFGYIGSGSVVKNVTVSDMRITGYFHVGGIVGTINYSPSVSVENSHATATVCLNAVQNMASVFGGIVGWPNMGNINSCTSAVTITVADNLTECRDFGGIVGIVNNDGNVSNCLAVGVAIPDISFMDYYHNDVTGSGAIAGRFDNGVLSNNYYSGCTLGGTPTASGIGVGYDNNSNDRHDVTDNDGAVPVPQQLADNATDNSDVIDNHNDKTVNVMLSGRTLYKDGDWNTLCLPFSLTAEQVAASPLAGWTLMTLDTDVGSYGHITGFENSALYLNFKPATSIVAGTPYIAMWNPAQSDLAISSEEEWNAFCASVNAGTSYAGKVVGLTADISVSTMAGTYYRPFEGTFNGDGHTLTVTLNNDGQSGTDDWDYGVAPFRFTRGATIKNLHVGGTITTSTRKYAAGIVGMTKSGTNSIQNCRVSAEIYSTIDGDGTHGGFVGKASGTVNISNCLFDGVLTTSEGNITNSCGGFVGWRDDPCSLSISNSLYDPAVIPDGKYAIGTYNSFTFTRNNNECVSHCYYTTVLGDAQGADASAMSNDQLLTALGDGWQISSGKVVPKKTKGNVPDITNPFFYGVTVENVNPEDRTVVSQDGKVSFTGTYDALSFSEDNRSILFLGAGNTLYYPQTGASIGACRAYFQLNGLSASDINPNNVKMFFGDESPTDGVGEVQGSKFKVQCEGTWYDLNGRRLSGKPTQKGIYVNNGKKIVIK